MKMYSIFKNTKRCMILHLIWLSHSEIYCARRQKSQNIAQEDLKHFKNPQIDVGPQTEGAGAAADRLSTWATKVSKTRTRSTPSGVTLDNHCDYIGQECLHAYQTGKLCAKTLYYYYSSFDSYCMLEYVNCMEGYELWQVVYMGECFNLTVIKEYMRVYGAKKNKTQATTWLLNRRQWPTPQYSPLLALRQNTADLMRDYTLPQGLDGTKQGGQAKQDAKRFSTKSTTPFKKLRSTKEYVSLTEECDYLAMNCLRSYQTGRLCGRAGYWRYFTFKNYCMLDYVNCKSRYETWQVIHMGDCLWIKPMTEYFGVDYETSGVMEGLYLLDREN